MSFDKVQKVKIRRIEVDYFLQLLLVDFSIKVDQNLKVDKLK